MSSVHGSRPCQHRGKKNDAAKSLNAHIPGRGPATQKCPGQVDVQRLFPLLRVELQKGLWRKHRWAKNEIIDSPSSVCNCVKGAFEISFVANVDLEQSDGMCVRRDFALSGPGIGFHVKNKNPRAFGD